MRDGYNSNYIENNRGEYYHKIIMEDYYNEEDFYKDSGWPTEHFCFCNYRFPMGMNPEWGEDYDKFILITNALYPYIRLSRKRGQYQSPCGLATVVAPENSYAKQSDDERDKECPKIAWGFAAIFIADLRYDDGQEDFVPFKGIDRLVREYYNKYLMIYMNNHNGLRFSKISNEQKELDFLAEHETIIRNLWDKSVPLKKYTLLYKYATEAESEYECFLKTRNMEIRKKMDMVSGRDTNLTTIRTTTQSGEKSVYIENNTGSVIIN